MLRAAIEIADKDGIDAVTMRRLGEELGVEAMSLYHHVANKDDVVAGMADVLLGEISVPAPGPDWRNTVRERALSARTIVAAHPWAPSVITSKRGGPSRAIFRYMDWFVGVLHDAGFSPELIHSAVHIVASRLFGFNDEAFSEGPSPEQTKPMADLLRTGEYPAITKVIVKSGLHHDDDHEFAFGLDLILDGLERARTAQRQNASGRRTH